MKKSYLFSIITIVILFLLVLTNPDSVVHKAKVKESILKDTELLSDMDNQSGWEVLGTTLGLSLIDKLIDTAIQVDNYVLFSLTRATWDDEDKIIGIGILGNVFFIKKNLYENDLDISRKEYWSNQRENDQNNIEESNPNNSSKLVAKLRGNGSQITDNITLKQGSAGIQFNVFSSHDEYCKVSLLSHGEYLSDASFSFFTDWNNSYSDHETLKKFVVHDLWNGEYYFEVEAPDNSYWNIEVYQ